MYKLQIYNTFLQADSMSINDIFKSKCLWVWVRIVSRGILGNEVKPSPLSLQYSFPALDSCYGNHKPCKLQYWRKLSLD